MEGKLTRNLISAVVIIAMVAGAFMLPLMDGDNGVNAATKKVKVKYKANGGKFSQSKYAKKSTVTKKVKKGKKRGAAPKIKRTGYKLKGWYTKKSKGKKTTTKTKIKKNSTLYAQWTANTYNVNLKYQNGQADEKKSIKYDSKYSMLTTPKRNGFHFDGWFTEAKGGKEVKNTDVHKVASDVTLYAQWTVVIDKTFYGFMGMHVNDFLADETFIAYSNADKLTNYDKDSDTMKMNLIATSPEHFFPAYSGTLTNDIILNQLGINWIEDRPADFPNGIDVYYFKDDNFYIYYLYTSQNSGHVINILTSRISDYM